MRNSKLPSMLGIVTVLSFYGGKREIRVLLHCLAKGGAQFYQNHVKQGYLFQTTCRNSNLVHLNPNVMAIYKKARQNNQEKMHRQNEGDDDVTKKTKNYANSSNALFKDVTLNLEDCTMCEMVDLKHIVTGHFKAHSYQTIMFSTLNLADLLFEATSIEGNVQGEVINL